MYKKISLISSLFLGTISYTLAAPNNGTVISGDATISQNYTTTNINQNSNKAIINWQDFSIKSNETVNFNQPNINSITLNKVTGNEKSIINGALNANGQVWILNSNGIIFDKNASINTSGLLATTSEISNEDFNSGNYNFTNSTSNSIINLGTITIDNQGYVILTSKEVQNDGTIEAIKGNIHLVGADEYSINLNGNSLVELTVNKGVLDALVKNSGSIIADGGEIFLTTNAADELLRGVVNNTGVIKANSLDDITGVVELFAHEGEVQVGGEITANEGFVETSGKDFKILENAKIKAKDWLIDPTNMNVTDATSYEDSLNSGSTITIVTNNSSGNDEGNIYINDTITWTTPSKLILNAYNNIFINKTITATNGQLALYYGQGAPESGNTSNYYVNAPINLKAGNNFFTKLGNNGGETSWTVITTLDALQNLSLSANSALGANLTYTTNTGVGFDPLGDVYQKFFGNFDGLGHTISNLYINRPTEDYVGLFGWVYSGDIKNLKIENAKITGNTQVGGLIGYTDVATIYNSNVTGTIKGANYIGGLIGILADQGGIYDSYTQGSVSGSNAGGLIGYSINNGEIKNSYSNSTVSGSNTIGGLIGYLNIGTITNSYSNGDVNGSTNAGGLIGVVNGSSTITNSFWDKNSSGQVTSAGGIGKTTDEMRYIGTFRDIGNWNIEIDNSLPDGPPILSYNNSGPIWKISPYTYNIPDATVTWSGNINSYTEF